jgi:hypothetical protein
VPLVVLHDLPIRLVERRFHRNAQRPSVFVMVALGAVVMDVASV